MYISCPVSGHYTRSAAVGEDREAGTFDPDARGECLGGGKPLADGGYPDRAGPFDSRVENQVFDDPGAGMGCRCARSALTAARLDHDDGFESRRAAQSADKGPRIGHTLDVEQDTPGV